MARATLQDVARTAGVSLATADRVLNRRPGVQAETADPERVVHALVGSGQVAIERNRQVEPQLGHGCRPFSRRRTRPGRIDTRRIAMEADRPEHRTMEGGRG